MRLTGLPNILEYYYALSAGERGIPEPPGVWSHPRSRDARSGSAGAIIPWNMPAISSWAGRSGRPLVAGNTVVLKPCPDHPRVTCGKLAEILARVPGLPSGVLNVGHRAGGDGRPGDCAQPCNQEGLVHR